MAKGPGHSCAHFLSSAACPRAYIVLFSARSRSSTLSGLDGVATSAHHRITPTCSASTPSGERHCFRSRRQYFRSSMPRGMQISPRFLPSITIAHTSFTTSQQLNTINTASDLSCSRNIQQDSLIEYGPGDSSSLNGVRTANDTHKHNTRYTPNSYAAVRG